VKEEVVQEQVEVKEEVKQEEVKEEVVLITSHADACDPTMFGSFDPNSEYCVDCLKQFAECANACKALTDHKKLASPAGRAKSSATRTPRDPNSKTESGVPAIQGGGSTATIYNLMCRAEGATFAEMLACRRDTGKPQNVKDAALKKLIKEFATKLGANIVVDADKYFIRAAVVEVKEEVKQEEAA
jgi:hypothetical protein